MVQCQDLPRPDGGTLTDLARYAQRLISQYTDCRLAHDELVDWARGTHGRD